MRRTAIALALLIAGCGEAERAPAEKAEDDAEGPAASGPPAAGAASVWDLQASGEGSALVLAGGDGATDIRLFCPAGEDRLLVNVPAFRPIGSEERLSLGSNGEVEALVADPRGDPGRGGVSATGAVPANLAALITGPISASYGAQTSGPHPGPPTDLAQAFAAACRDGGAAAGRRGARVSACLVQGNERLEFGPLRAIGTEPFWAARIEGRCVTYSHPDDQTGTRVWTRYAATSDGGLWSGALGGRRFELRTRRQPGCSDGMSDKVYPIAVELLVAGERRRGCAEPA